MMKYFYLLFFFGFSLVCTAQKSYKHEKEERIEKKAFPQNALDLLEKTLPKKITKVKYYKEQDSIKISYEIKLKYKGRKYSVEFSKEGLLEDVEVTVKQQHIPPKTLEKVKKHFYNTYSAFRIKKIQRQYNNTPTIDAETVMKNAFSNDRKSSYSYEIIAEVKTKKKRYFIEITFTKEGDFTLVRTVIPSSYDHILY
ncbi:hypothetical protein [uncultured Kordia sp.]|uniref:hypothetical protein n=1 Tax=uncultured Kordia sp. TaxID=507699 RepID=UPI002634CFA3|nr:hypothetical protein [uncultured Kordia sp.]